jgi:hypothetical protein
MRMFLKTLSCVCISLIFAGVCQGKEWRGLVPLHSTRQDVERIFGKPISKTRWNAVYKKGRQRVLITFSKGGCRKNSYGWKVPAGRVEYIYVYPPEDLTLDDLKLDLSKYRRSLDVHQRILHYTDDEEGFEISVVESNKRVMISTYYPTVNDDHMRCFTPRQSPRQRLAHTPNEPDSKDCGRGFYRGLH